MIGDRIKEERNLSGFTQEEVADFLGVDRSTYTYYESGALRVPVAVLTKIAQFFGIPENFYMYENAPRGVFRSEDFYSMSDARKKEFLEDLSDARPISETLPESFRADEADDEEDGLSLDERRMLARVRLLKKNGFSRELDDVMDDLLDLGYDDT